MTTDPAHSHHQGDALLARVEETQEQVAQAAASLDQMHRLATLGTLAASIAHEYHNLMTPIIGYAQIAAMHPEDPELAQKAIQAGLEAATRATAISESILGLTAPSEQDAICSLAACTEAALKCLVRDPAKDGIRVACEVEDFGVAMSQIDLQQVILNLVLNARKAMRQGGGVLFLASERHPSNAKVCCLVIQDTGPGIPDAMIDRLFEPFATHPITPQGPVAGKRSGTGLGLSFCKQVISRAGGEIRAENNPEGARFTLELPITR